MSTKLKGKMKKFYKKEGYGFIITSDNKEIKCYRNDFLLSPLTPGEEVNFYLVKNENKVQAKEIECAYAYFFKHNVLSLDNCDYDQFCDNAKEYAKKLLEGKVTTSMIRKVYGQIMKAKKIEDIKHLRPQLAYIAGRNSDKPRVRELIDIFDFLAKNAKTGEENHLNYIQQFAEAIVAYLKFVGDDK